MFRIKSLLTLLQLSPTSNYRNEVPREKKTMYDEKDRKSFVGNILLTRFIYIQMKNLTDVTRKYISHFYIRVIFFLIKESLKKTL